jgi:hypothetical protein
MKRNLIDRRPVMAAFKKRTRIKQWRAAMRVARRGVQPSREPHGNQ